MVYPTQIFSTISASLNKIRITVGLTTWATRTELTQVLSFFFLLLLISCHQKNDEPEEDETPQYVQFDIRPDQTYQTIRNFGASDAWSCQFVGNWPNSKKEQIAKWLFSQEIDESGTPEGIGLSAWRFNIGGGSAEQGLGSDIHDEWRRAECFLTENGEYDWTKQAGQRWFLNQANSYGVSDLICFVNSPPVYYTKNGKAYSSGGFNTNLSSKDFDQYASFLSNVVSFLEDNGISMDYVSPFNEPQWDWDRSSQEGSPWTNAEIAAIAKLINQKFVENGIQTKIEIPEAAQVNYLYESADKPGRGNQISEFFDLGSANYVGDLDLIASKIAGHSYYTTWDFDHFIAVRNRLDQERSAVDPSLEYWMTEYCVLEDNDEINGNGKDLGMKTALYTARVIHTDLTVANASAWQWWLAISPYNYKDGLVYISKDKNDGSVQDSKTLWILGQYSRFIRPGMIRVAVDRSDGRSIRQNLDSLMASSYVNEFNQTVTVIINYSDEKQAIKLSKTGVGIRSKWYLTNASSENDLKYQGNVTFEDVLMLPAKSVSTFVEN